MILGRAPLPASNAPYYVAPDWRRRSSGESAIPHREARKRRALWHPLACGAMPHGIPHAADAFSGFKFAAAWRSMRPNPLHCGAREERHVDRFAARDPRTAPRPRGAALRARAAGRRLDPLHHPRDPADRNAERGGAGDHRAQRRDAAAGGRHRVPRLSRGRSQLFKDAGCDIKGERVRFPRGLARQPLRDDAGAICAARAQSRAQRRHRRQGDGVRAQLRLALRARSRQGPALRHDRGLPAIS